MQIFFKNNISNYKTLRDNSPNSSSQSIFYKLLYSENIKNTNDFIGMIDATIKDEYSFNEFSEIFWSEIFYYCLNVTIAYNLQNLKRYFKFLDHEYSDLSHLNGFLPGEAFLKNKATFFSDSFFQIVDHIKFIKCSYFKNCTIDLNFIKNLKNSWQPLNDTHHGNPCLNSYFRYRERRRYEDFLCDIFYHNNSCKFLKQWINLEFDNKYVDIENNLLKILNTTNNLGVAIFFNIIVIMLHIYNIYNDKEIFQITFTSIINFFSNFQLYDAKTNYRGNTCLTDFFNSIFGVIAYKTTGFGLLLNRLIFIETITYAWNIVFKEKSFDLTLLNNKVFSLNQSTLNFETLKKDLSEYFYNITVNLQIIIKRYNANLENNHISMSFGLFGLYKKTIQQILNSLSKENYPEIQKLAKSNTNKLLLKNACFSQDIKYVLPNMFVDNKYNYNLSCNNDFLNFCLTNKDCYFTNFNLFNLLILYYIISSGTDKINHTKVFSVLESFFKNLERKSTLKLTNWYLSDEVLQLKQKGLNNFFKNFVFPDFSKLKINNKIFSLLLLVKYCYNSFISKNFVKNYLIRMCYAKELEKIPITLEGDPRKSYDILLFGLNLIIKYDYVNLSKYEAYRSFIDLFKKSIRNLYNLQNKVTDNIVLEPLLLLHHQKLRNYYIAGPIFYTIPYKTFLLIHLSYLDLNTGSLKEKLDDITFSLNEIKKRQLLNCPADKNIFFKKRLLDSNFLSNKIYPVLNKKYGKMKLKLISIITLLIETNLFLDFADIVKHYPQLTPWAILHINDFINEYDFEFSLKALSISFSQFVNKKRNTPKMIQIFNTIFQLLKKIDPDGMNTLNKYDKFFKIITYYIQKEVRNLKIDPENSSQTLVLLTNLIENNNLQKEIISNLAKEPLDFKIFLNLARHILKHKKNLKDIADFLNYFFIHTIDIKDENNIKHTFILCSDHIQKLSLLFETNKNDFINISDTLFTFGFYSDFTKLLKLYPKLKKNNPKELFPMVAEILTQCSRQISAIKSLKQYYDPESKEFKELIDLAIAKDIENLQYNILKATIKSLNRPLNKEEIFSLLNNLLKNKHLTKDRLNEVLNMGTFPTTYLNNFLSLVLNSKNIDSSYKITISNEIVKRRGSSLTIEESSLLIWLKKKGVTKCHALFYF